MHPDGTWWDYKWAKEPAEVIAADFHAPFLVYAVGKTYDFVTQCCECYGLKDAGKVKRTTERVWGKEDQPIGRLITDTATGTTFAFTIPLERKDGTKAKPGYFELSPKPELIEYDPAKMKKNDFECPYKQICESVDVLLADQQIDPANHKPKERKYQRSPARSGPRFPRDSAARTSVGVPQEKPCVGRLPRYPRPPDHRLPPADSSPLIGEATDSPDRLRP